MKCFGYLTKFQKNVVLTYREYLGFIVILKKEFENVRFYKVEDDSKTFGFI